MLKLDNSQPRGKGFHSFTTEIQRNDNLGTFTNQFRHFSGFETSIIPYVG